jgi:hypothetical protein
MRSFSELFDQKVRVRLKFPLLSIPDNPRQFELLATLVETEGPLTAIEKIGRHTFICVGTTWINLEEVQHLQLVSPRPSTAEVSPRANITDKAAEEDEPG